MSTREHRKAIPIGVKMQACLLLLGFTEDEIAGGAVQWDHHPALALRFVDPETGEMSPAPNDPRYLRPLRKAEHAEKTFGRKATTAGSDVGLAAKVKRLDKSEAEFRRRLLAKSEPTAFLPMDHEDRGRKRAWPSRPFPSRKHARNPKARTHAD
ncbi:hypothetical protein ABEG18_13215 [Alsobacter sp. KACC 23698]|uniref:Uncharacterized protein n=1 Tax=Alsobacter sp. KACC 23698 TaxID=3149229 RepID=A0AAU7J975_9HYPH